MNSIDSTYFQRGLELVLNRTTLPSIHKAVPPAEGVARLRRLTRP